MSQKNVGAILLLIATALGGPPAVQHVIDVQDQVLSSVAIEGPSTVEVGELVILKVTGDRPSWLPPVEDAYVNGDLCILSFREPGEYEVIASSVSGMATKVVKHVVTVGKVEPITPPKPEPSPTPTPEPDADKAGELTGLVYSWCVEAKTDRDVAKELGDNFVYAATNSTTIDELLQKVSERNRKVDQKTAARVLAKIQQHLYDELAGKDFVTHQCAFSEIGDGFLKYAGDSNGGSSHPGFWKGL